MTFSEHIKNLNGYETITTFWDDFSIADMFGIDAIKGTYNRAFDEWKTDHKYLTELVLVLNHKIWFWHKKNDEYAQLYNELWRQTDTWAMDNLDKEEFNYYWKVLD